MGSPARFLALLALAVAAVGLLVGLLKGDVMFGLFLLFLGAMLGAIGAVLNGIALRRGDGSARTGLRLSLAAVLLFPLALLMLFVGLSVGGFS